MRPPRHHGDREAGGRPERAPPCRPVPGPRPARRPGRRAGPDLCVPVVHPPRRGLRHGPRHPLLRGRHRRRATTSHPLCRRHHRLKTHHSGWGYTVLEPGSYLWSLTARLPVPARPPRHHRRHPRPGHRTRPTSSDPAPHPAPATLPARGHRHVPGRMSRPAPPPPPSLRARESVSPGRCSPVTAAGGERKGWRGGAGASLPQPTPPPTRHPPATAGGGRPGRRSEPVPRAPDA